MTVEGGWCVPMDDDEGFVLSAHFILSRDHELACGDEIRFRRWMLVAAASKITGRPIVQCGRCSQAIMSDGG